MAGGSTKPIEAIGIGDLVLAFDGFGALVPRRVARLYRNVTDRWTELSFAQVARAPVVVTPGHAFLAVDGRFETIEGLLRQGGGSAHVVLADGSSALVRGRVITLHAGTASLYPQSRTVEADGSLGNLALAPHVRHGWTTFNFEVEDLHTYVAAGIRVHNASGEGDSEFRIWEYR